MLKLFFLYFITSSLWASSIQFQSFSNDSCFYGIKEESLFVASFNDSKAYKLSKSQLYDVYKNWADKSGLNIDEAKNQVMIHCGAYGSSLVIQLMGKEEDLCIWLDGELSQRGVGIKRSDEASTCQGIRPGVLFLNLLDELNNSELNQFFEQNLLKEKIQSFSFISKKIVKINLKGEFHFSVLSLIEELRAMNPPQLKSIEGDQMYYPVGDFQLIDFN